MPNLKYIKSYRMAITCCWKLQRLTTPLILIYVFCIEMVHHKKIMSLWKALEFVWCLDMRMRDWQDNVKGLQDSQDWDQNGHICKFHSNNTSKSRTAISRRCCVKEVCVFRIHSLSESDCATAELQYKAGCTPDKRRSAMSGSVP